MKPKRIKQIRMGWGCLRAGHFHLTEKVAATCIAKSQTKSSSTRIARAQAFAEHAEGFADAELLAGWALGAWVTYARYEARLTLRKIGDRVGLSTTRIAQIEAKHLRKVRGSVHRGELSGLHDWLCCIAGNTPKQWCAPPPSRPRKPRTLKRWIPPPPPPFEMRMVICQGGKIDGQIVQCRFPHPIVGVMKEDESHFAYEFSGKRGTDDLPIYMPAR